jgi:hypothetical protein
VRSSIEEPFSSRGDKTSMFAEDLVVRPVYLSSTIKRTYCDSSLQGSVVIGPSTSYRNVAAGGYTSASIVEVNMNLSMRGSLTSRGRNACYGCFDATSMQRAVSSRRGS